MLHLMFGNKNSSLFKRKESLKFTRNAKMRRKMIIKTIFSNGNLIILNLFVTMGFLLENPNPSLKADKTGTKLEV